MPFRTHPASAPKWTADEITNLIHSIRASAASLVRRLHESGDSRGGADAMLRSTMMVCPPVYLYIACGYGDFDSLRLSKPDLASYMIFLSSPAELCREILDSQGSFGLLLGMLGRAESAMLADICGEIIDLENSGKA